MPKKRPKAVKDVTPVMHIYCEGEKTEPAYFKKYLEKTRPGDIRTKVIQIEATKKNTPIQLIDVAIEKLRSCPEGDTFWVVFDRESHQKYKDELHHQAYSKARGKGINIAISNVCFELWILLHFQDCSSPYVSFDDLMAKSGLKKQLQDNGIQSYEKGESRIFDLIQGDVAQARIRAKEMSEATKAAADAKKTMPYQLNPYCDVYLLLDAIDEFV